MKLFSWNTWDLDIWTYGWIVWSLFFFVWEFLSAHFAGQGGGEMLTDHLRPLFHVAPVTWFMVFGLWVWLGIHFLAPTFERWLAEVVSNV